MLRIEITALAASLLALVALSVAAPALAIDSGAAYSLCKQTAIAQHGKDARVTLKKIKDRASRAEVRIRVRVDGESFKAECIIEADAVSRYTAQNGSPASAVATTR